MRSASSNDPESDTDDDFMSVAGSRPLVSHSRSTCTEVFGQAGPRDHLVELEPLLGNVQSESHQADEHTIRPVSDDLRLVIAGGLALMLFLVIFALGQLQEIFRALGH